jgi:hypothetical protein
LDLVQNKRIAHIDSTTVFSAWLKTQNNATISHRTQFLSLLNYMQARVLTILLFARFKCVPRTQSMTSELTETLLTLDINTICASHYFVTVYISKPEHPRIE